MKAILHKALTVSCTLTLAAALQTAGTVVAYAGVPPYTGNECTEVTVDAFSVLSDIINQARAAATTDVAANGVTGRNAEAARDSLFLIERAGDEVAQILTFLKRPGGQNPAITTYAEAGHMDTKLMEIIRALSAGTYWASLSTIYHASLEARDTFEIGSEALSLAADLKVLAGRCYMDAYF